MKTLLLTLALTTNTLAQIPEQYPKPLLHTPTNHPATRVLLLSVDGLHAFDLAGYITTHPHSALADLSSRGVTYTNAHTPVSDPAAGLAALVTGGTPISTGIISIRGFGMYPGGRDDPHLNTRVNTIFEVATAKIGPTAWAGESVQTIDILNGPSRKGLGEVCTLDTSPNGDETRVNQVLHLIRAKSCSGDQDKPVPVLFGMSFTSIAHAQQTAGYLDALATPSPGLAKALDATDASIARLIAGLKAAHLYDSTWIIIASPFGQSPIDPRSRTNLPSDAIQKVIQAAAPGAIAHITEGGSVMLWLNDHAQAHLIAKTLSDHAKELGIQSIRSGSDLTLTLNSPAHDPRTPDIILQPQPGLRWTYTGPNASATGPDAPALPEWTTAVIAGYGGTLEDDTHVALLISGAQLTGRTDPTWVPTTQLAPLLMRSFGMEKFDLDALHQEHTPALPGIF